MFPKPPSRPASGKLKLIIKPSHKEIEAEVSPAIPAGTSDSLISFKVPAGFSIATNTESLLAAQISGSLSSLDIIEARYLKCKTCRNTGYSSQNIETAKRVLKEINNLTISFAPHIFISHDKSGDIYLNLEVDKKLLYIRFCSPTSIKEGHDHQIGLYLNNELQEILSFDDVNLRSSLEWVRENLE